MAFFDKLRRAFGLDGSVDYDDEIEGIDATVTPLRQRREEYNTDFQPRVTAVAEVSRSQNSQPAEESGTLAVVAESSQPTASAPKVADGGADSDSPVPSEIFRTVIEIFNRSLPDFLGSTVDAERQEQYLYNALEKGMKSYLDSLETQSRRRYQEQRQADMLRIENEMQQLRDGMKAKDEEAAEAHKAQLSAERQKRALSERVHDLEKQVAALEAEAEQHDLENKSLVNKVRLYETQEKDLEAVRSMSAEASAELEALRAKNAELAGMLASRDKELADAIALNKQESGEKDLALAALREENGQKTTLLAELQQKMAESQTAGNAELEEYKKKVEDMTAAAAESSNEIASLTQQLAKAKEKLGIVAEIQTQVEQLEYDRLNTQGQIRSLKDELMEKDELIRHKDSDLRDKNMLLAQRDAAIRRMEDQVDSLHKQMENAIYEHSQSETVLRGEIARLKNLQFVESRRTETAPEAVAAPQTETEKPAEAQPSVAVAETEIVGVSSSEPEETAPTAKKKSGKTGAKSAKKTGEAKGTLVKVGDISLDLEDLPIVDDKIVFEKEISKTSKSRKASSKKEKITAEEPAEKAPEAALPKKEAAPEPVAEKTEPKLDDFDFFDNDNWLVSEPEVKKTKPARNESADTDDFGYHEPKRTSHPDNPAQMSLF